MSSSVRHKNITFDDRDDRLKYAGNWFHDGTWNASSVHQTGTLSSSNDPQANVTFTFPQPAIAFYYYGIARSRGALYAICIDCDPNNPRFEPVDGLNSTDDGTNPPIVLYSRVFDSPGQHVVILTNQNDTRGTPLGNSQLTIDRFDLEILIDDSPAVISTVTQDPSNPGPGTSTAPTATSSSSSSAPIGAIAGGAVGGFGAAVILIAIGLFCLRRRHRRRRMGGSIPPPAPPQPTHVEPFPVQAYSSKGPRISIRPTPATVTLGTDTDLSSSLSPSTVTGSYDPPSSGTYSSNTSSSDQSSSRRARRERRRERRREVDAGPILEEDDGAENEDSLPPLYEQVFRTGRQRSVNQARSSSAPNYNDHTTSIPLTPLRRGPEKT
ncbi:hypothetical protein E1B28_001712 [Marasmius oreades]|uniref:Uncharacterized protein n=1 Tax=Marasmius oreades TaxID=181124 RepID=A0A9P8AFQ4_9AGAR|nr:uncharacterized protein E1B28_001712 [Marasmius oreades]KAG7099914.1 hypothetical protein E1B28_001712 [Marasmius oreades]